MCPADPITTIANYLAMAVIVASAGMVVTGYFRLWQTRRIYREMELSLQRIRALRNYLESAAAIAQAHNGPRGHQIPDYPRTTH